MSNTLRELAVVEYGASPKDIRVDYKSLYKIYGTGGEMGYASKFLFQGPLVVVARKGTLDNPIYTDDSCWVIDTAYAVIPKDGVNTKWLYYQLSNYDLRKLNEATAVPSINRNFLYNIHFPKTPLSEQKHIAHILSTCDAVIEKTQSAIAKYKAIKQGMLHDLFTRGIDVSTGKLRPSYEDAPEFYKESKLGWIPREWEVESLENLRSLITKGESPNWQGYEYQETGILFVTSENVRDGEMDIVRNKKFIPLEFYVKLGRSQLLKDDVLINLVGASIARSAHFNLDIPANINQAVALIRIDNSKLNVYWFSYYLQFPDSLKRLLGEQVETARANLSLRNLNMFLVAKPSFAEQQIVAARLKAIYDKLQTEQTYLEKMKLLRKGLMEDLLSGRKRVPITAELQEN